MRGESKINAVLKEFDVSHTVILMVQEKPVKKRLKRMEIINNLLGRK